MLKAIIFDMDGVMVDTELGYLEIFRNTLNMHEIEFEESVLYRCVGLSYPLMAQLLDDIVQPKMSGMQFIDILKYETEKQPIDYKSVMMEGLHELLQYCKSKDLKIGLASASPHDVIEEAVDQLQIKEYFDYILSGESIERSKPHPDIYLQVMKQLTIQPEECIVIEDSKNGIAAGVSANAYVIALRDTIFNMDQEAAHVKVDSLLEIIPLINERGSL